MNIKKEEVVKMKSKNTTNDHEVRIVRIEVIIENINQTLIRIDKRFDKIESEINDLRKESIVQFRWVMGTLILSIVLPTILKIFHFI